ncbi:uncharacterized protein [Neodiprion pinetum]|uniref:uncharacterized protein isoform X2 n=1 Tax=Neodiprion pinetum TaxID=441929 RepID=UPI003723196D
MEILPGEISFNKGACKCYTEFISDFEKYGGIQRSRGSALRATSSRRRADWSLICASLENLSGSEGSELRERQHVGCFSPDVITFVDTDSIAVGVLELTALFILTGFLVMLSVLSHIAEWIFVIVTPMTNYFLHQVNDLILLILYSWLLSDPDHLNGPAKFPCDGRNVSLPRG